MLETEYSLSKNIDINEKIRNVQKLCLVKGTYEDKTYVSFFQMLTVAQVLLVLGVGKIITVKEQSLTKIICRGSCDV